MSTNVGFAAVFAGGSFPLTTCFMLSGRSEAIADAKQLRPKTVSAIRLIGLWLLLQPKYCTYYVPALKSAAPSLISFLSLVSPPLIMIWFMFVLVFCRIARLCAFCVGISPTRQAAFATVVHLAASLRLLHRTPGERMLDMLAWILPPFTKSIIAAVTNTDHWMMVFFVSPLCATPTQTLAT